MTFGITNGSEDMLSSYLGSTATNGLAAALSGHFQASPSFDLSEADDPFATAQYAGTGLSTARNVDAGALSYNQALNYTPPGGAMITKAQALAGIDLKSLGIPGAIAALAAVCAAGYYGHQRYGIAGGVGGPLAVLGLLRLLQGDKT